VSDLAAHQLVRLRAEALTQRAPSRTVTTSASVSSRRLGERDIEICGRRRRVSHEWIHLLPGEELDWIVAVETHRSTRRREGHVRAVLDLMRQEVRGDTSFRHRRA